jgi:hypothetical protein
MAPRRKLEQQDADVHPARMRGHLGWQDYGKSGLLVTAPKFALHDYHYRAEPACSSTISQPDACDHLPGYYERWLSPGSSARSVAASAETVSSRGNGGLPGLRLVNSPDNDVPECILPVAEI